MLRIVAILLLCFIVVNLFAGLFHILRGRDGGSKTLRALVWRVALSILLFVMIVAASQFGFSPRS